MSCLFSALPFMHNTYFDRQPNVKKEKKNSKKTLKIILICCHGNQNVYLVIMVTDCQIGNWQMHIFISL